MHHIKQFTTSILILLYAATQLHAQGPAYEKMLKAMQLKEYSIVTKTDTIYFLATEPGKKKKTIVFCTGSGPVPLFVSMPEGTYPCFFPVDIDSNTRKDFNMVFIAKPGIKRFATSADISLQLAKQGQFLQLDSMNRPPAKYIAGNNLYKLGGDCMKVIRYLKKQPWVDAGNIFVYGHSQGAMVAAYVAYKDHKNIKGLIYSQCNAYGMHAGYLSTILYDPQLPEADIIKKMDSVYNMYRDIINGIPDTSVTAEILYNKKTGDFYNTYSGRWRSLEEPPAINYLLKTNIPILLINGLGSTGELDNKNIPLDFIRQHKTNLTAKYYPGYDHNFFKKTTDKDGNPKDPEFHWDEVFNNVKKWINEQ